MSPADSTTVSRTLITLLADTDKYCSVVAPNEYGPSSGNKDGVTCGSRNENNWCKAGYAAIFDGDNDLTCPGDSPTCTGGTTLCSGTCVDTLSSFSNCGRCGNVCTSASTGCVGGTCYIPPADTITTTTTTTTTREIITTTTAAPPKSTDSNAAASTATYVSAPASVSMPSGAKIASIVNGDRITLRTSSAGLSCSTSGSRSCSLNSAAEGLYNIKCVSFDCKVSLLTSLANTGSCLTVIDNGVVAERTCPSNSKREVVEAYWTLLEANGQRKLMLSTRSESNGCLLATSNVGVGACSDSTAGLWGFQTETVKETTTAGPPIGAIVGGVVGGIAVIAVIAGIVWYKRRKPSAEKPAELGDVKKQEREGPPVVPFAAPNKPAEMDYAPPAPAVLGTAVAGDMDGRYPGASPSPTPTAQPRQEPSSPIGIPINGMYTAAGSYFAAADDELVARPGGTSFFVEFLKYFRTRTD